MPTRVGALLDFVQDILGDLLIAASVIFFFTGLLFISPFYQWTTVITLFLGVVLLVSGVAIRLEGPLTLTMPSRGGFSTILICISLVTIATAGILLLFTTPGGWKIINVIFHGVIIGQEIVIKVAHPLSWLFMPLAVTGLGLLFIGVLLRFYDLS